MRKRTTVLSGAALTALLLTGCGSDDNGGDDAAAGAATEENGGSDGPPTDGDGFDDQLGLGLGEKGYVDTSTGERAFTVDGVAFLGFEDLVAEHGADVHPSFDPELVATVEVTVENIQDEEIDAGDAVDMLEFGPADDVEDDMGGQSQMIRAGDPDFDVPGLFEGPVAPGETVSGTLYFPVFDADADRWGVTISRGIEACCTDNDLSWIFEADAHA